MFDGAQSVEVVNGGIRLTGPKKLDHTLESSNCQLILDSCADLIVRSELNWDYSKPDEAPVARITISCKFEKSSDNLFAFKKDNFIGRIGKVTLYCVQSNKTIFHAGLFEPDGDIDETVAIHITAHLEANLFKEIFHPIWLRQAKSRLQLVIGVMGYQNGAEAAFGEPWDTRNFVFQVGRLQLEMRSIALVTPLQ